MLAELRAHRGTPDARAQRGQDSEQGRLTADRIRPDLMASRPESAADLPPACYVR